MERPIQIKILDHVYLLKSDESEEQVQEIVQFVNDKLEEIRVHTDRLPEVKIALLAAFHVANDYFQLLRERDGLKHNVEQRARSLNLQIDSVVD